VKRFVLTGRSARSNASAEPVSSFSETRANRHAPPAKVLRRIHPPPSGRLHFEERERATATPYDWRGFELDDRPGHNACILRHWIWFYCRLPDQQIFSG
jgi:hypothetical protein